MVTYGDVFAVGFAPDGRVLTGSGDQTARVWRASDGATLHILEEHESSVKCIAASPDNATVATGCCEIMGSDQAVRLWRLADGALLRTCVGPAACMGCGCLCLAFTPDSRYVVSGYQSSKMRVWRADDGKKVREWEVRCGDAARGGGARRGLERTQRGPRRQPAPKVHGEPLPRAGGAGQEARRGGRARARGLRGRGRRVPRTEAPTEARKEAPARGGGRDAGLGQGLRLAVASARRFRGSGGTAGRPRRPGRPDDRPAARATGDGVSRSRGTGGLVSEPAVHRQGGAALARLGDGRLRGPALLLSRASRRAVGHDLRL
mmetsp:Transcript_20632/g.63496  ORF Transcript_20632/g.63496 Transcript_20632/m.63496 type:complete len:319 (-) Transcript_20632:519-1475(-)